MNWITRSTIEGGAIEFGVIRALVICAVGIVKRNGLIQLGLNREVRWPLRALKILSDVPTPIPHCWRAGQGCGGEEIPADVN